MRRANHDNALRSKLWNPLPLLGILGALSGCGGDSVPESDGEPRIWGDSLVLVEEVRIGGLDDDQLLAQVAAVAPAPDGSVYIADSQLAVVRHYDATGAHIRDLGNRGEGPGEFGRIAGLAVRPDGALVVWDAGLNRLNVFDSDGALLSTSMIPDARGAYRGFVWGDGGRTFVTLAPGGANPMVEIGQLDWGEVLDDGSVERLHSAPAADSEGPSFVLAGPGGYYRPFNTMTLSTVGPDGTLWTVRNDEYRITGVRTDGDSVMIARDEEPIELTAEELDEWEARAQSFIDRDPQLGTDGYLPIPEVKPFIRELVTDPEGRLWVSRYTEPVFMEYTPEQAADREARGLASYQWRDTLTWDVFDRDGRFLGVVTFPLRTTLSTAMGDRVWGVREGELGEQLVIQWRIEPVG